MSIVKAKERIARALRGRIAIANPETDVEREEELSTFYASLAITKAASNAYLSKRMAIAYAKAYYEAMDDALALADSLGISHKGLSMHVSDYLNYAPESIDYSLFTKPLSKGYVELTPHEFKRVLQEAIRERIARLIPLAPIDERIKRASQEIRKLIPKFSKVKVKMKDFPPCIEKILSRLSSHENLSHYERWALAVFLINIGYEVDDIVKLYSSLPDFSEKITRYQVEHIQKKGYKMPSCEKMRGYGLCVADCGIENPLRWKRGKAKVDKQKNS